jgi:Tripartite tricarboxylate transporter family receptor
MRTSKHWCGRNAHRLQSRGDRRERGPRSIPHIHLLIAAPKCGDASLATAPSLYAELTFDPAKNLVPIAMFATVPHIVVASPEVGVRSLDELIALAKTPPASLTSVRVGSVRRYIWRGKRFGSKPAFPGLTYRTEAPARRSLPYSAMRFRSRRLRCPPRCRRYKPAKYARWQS